MTSHRVRKYQAEENEEQLRLNLDLMDEVRMDAEQRTARYKNLMSRQYDAMVKPRRFKIGENLGQIGKNLIELSTARGKDPTIWKLWVDGG